MIAVATDLEARIQNRLKIRHFTLLLTIERFRSVSRAAEALNISQPTLTKALSDIEEIFQMPLFVRTGRGVEPTVAGEVVLNRARYAVADTTTMRHELEGLKQGLQGRLRLGVIPYVSAKVASQLWQHVLDFRPKVSVLVQEGTTPALIQGLRERSIDCAICRFGGESQDDGLEHAILYKEQPYLVVSAGCERMLERNRNGDLSAWQEMDWIFPPPTRMRALIENMFAEQGLRVPVPRVETYAVRSIASALSHLPRGISILPLEMAEQVVATGVARRSLHPLPTELPPVGLAWIQGGAKERFILQLLECLRA